MQAAPTLWDSGYTLAVPFTVDLPDGSHVSCEQVVRAMPGRRYVCRGRWNGRAVFIKLFATSKQAKREWHNEQTGIVVLHEAVIAAPQLVYTTSLQEPPAHLLIYEELQDAECSRERWEQGDEASRHALLEDLVDLIATHHAAGLVQQDLHMRNFLYSGGILYTLDAADIAFSSKALAREAAMENLASLFALLRSEYDKWIPDFYTRYMQHRNLETGDYGLQQLLKSVHKQRRYKQKKFLDKIFRDCSAFVAKSNWQRFYVYDRQADNTGMCELVQNPDVFLKNANASIIKAGNTCTVTAFEHAGKKLISKRYNMKNVWHRLSRALRPTRASQSWRNAHCFLMHGIQTAQPVALIEDRFGPVRGLAWFVMQSVEGPSAHEYFRDPAISAEARRHIAVQFTDMLHIMLCEKISHGDMKATNFIINNDRLVVIDLDAVCQHRQQSSFARAFRRDLQRFFRNWQDLPEIEALFREVLGSSAVGQYLPDA